MVALLCGVLLAACAQPAAPAAPPPAGAPSGEAPSAAAPAATSAPALIPLKVAYAAPAGTQTPIWIAYERGLLREQGLEIELLHLSGTRTDQGVVTGETPIAQGLNVVPTRLAGADVVAILGVVSRMPFSLYARQGITSPQDLRGKTMATTLPGAAATQAAHLVVRHFGLEPNRDVGLQPTGGAAEQFAILAQGLVDAGLLAPPATLKADELGLVRLATNDELSIPYLNTAIGITRDYGRDHPDVVRRFLRGYVNAIVMARRDPEGTKALIGKYTNTEDPVVLDETYRFYRPLWGRPDFRVPPEAIAANLRVADVPGADTARPEDFVDNRFVDELHDSGFIRQAGGLDP